MSAHFPSLHSPQDLWTTQLSHFTHPVKGACFNESDRPLLEKVTPAQFSDAELQRIKYDFESPRLVFTDGEPDDFLALIIELLSQKAQVVAEPHGKREGVYERTHRLIENLHHCKTQLQKGNAAPDTIRYLIDSLKYIDDHSLLIQVIAPSPTLSALIQAAPELLAKKTKRIVTLGGFAFRQCEMGKLQGQKVYYTTHNLSANIESGQSLFSFSEKYKVPLYILSTDNLRLPRDINFDVVQKLESLGTDAAEYILDECAEWNKATSKKTEKIAKEVGKKPEQQSMTPADAIAAVFGLAFDSLVIKSRGMSSIQITEEPRYEDGKESKHRAVALKFDDDSKIRYVDGFSLENSRSNTAETFQVLLNHLINISWKTQQIGEHPMDIQGLGRQRQVYRDDEKSNTAPMEIVREPQSSSSSGQLHLEPPTPVALRQKPVTLEELISSDPATQKAMNTKCQTPTVNEINQCVEKKDFFGLKILLENLIISEYYTGKHDLELRDYFRDAFTKLQTDLKDQVKPLEAQIKSMGPSREKEGLEHLLYFITEGRGAETVRIYAKILLPLDPLDLDYKDKIMQYAKNQWHFRAKDTVPGTDRPLGQLKNDAKAKHNIKIEESLRIPERTEVIRSAIEAMKKDVNALSGRLSEIEFINQFAKDQPCDVFVRGAMGVGKSRFLEENLGLKENQLFSSDALKKHKAFGNTPLAHHESAAAKDELDDYAAKSVKRRVHGQSNVRGRDNEIIANTAKNKQCLVIDLSAFAETITHRVENRVKQGGRALNQKEFDESIDDSVNNRPALIQTALENKNIHYILFDANGKEPKAVLEVRNGKAKALDNGTLVIMCQFDLKLNALISGLIKPVDPMKQSA